MVRRVVPIVAAVGLVAAALVLGATPAHAFPIITFNVTKVVVGDPPPGTIFEVRIECDQGSPLTSNFDATGGTESITSNADGNCAVSEPVDGNADSTTFACDALQNVTCDTSTFSIDGDPGEVNVTVTNTFVPSPPPAAAAVEAAPTFTG